MTSDRFLKVLATRSIVVAVAGGIFANLIANWLSARLEDPNSTPWFKATLLLGCLAILLTWIMSTLVTEIKRLQSTAQRAEVSGVTVQHPTRSLADVLPDVREELWFFGILAKRSVSDDRFKEFLRSNSSRGLKLRFLLLNPDSPAFLARADEERESPQSWKQELNATIERLRHYKQLFDVDIQLRFYDFYPVWRLIVVDRLTVITNCFVEGMRGTESQQFAMIDSGPQTHLAHMFVKLFKVVWAHHSIEVAL